MKKALALLVAAFASLAAADEVVTLTKDTFQGHLSQHENVLVEFYAPWCGHCKALAPEYEAAAVELTAAGKAGALAKVDCTTEKDLCAEYKVQGFPTLKLFTKNVPEPTDYEDARKKDALVKFIQKAGQPPFEILSTQADVDAFFKADDAIEVVAYLDNESSEQAEAFKAAAALLKNDFDLAISKIPAKGASMGQIVLYRNFDTPVVVMPADESLETAAEIVEFANNESLPNFGEIGPENFQKYVERKLPLMWVFADYVQNADALKAVEPNADDFKGKLLFTKLDGVRWGEHAKSFGLQTSTPGIVIEDRLSRKNYLYDMSTPITEESIKKFATDFVEGKLTANVKSEPIPESQPDAVVKIVGKTFESVVMDDTKDVFVEFFAPWCGHCKSLKPKFEELAKMFKTNANVVIGAIDATENDTPVDIEGFPTLFFYPAGGKADPVKYSGERSVEAMASFVKQHATTLTAGQPEAEDAAGKEEL